MWVFGSRHKKTSGPNSDLDIDIEVEWVAGQMLGVCESAISLWSAASKNFKDEMTIGCPWFLDIQLYAGDEETPMIHKYLLESSSLIYEKT
jgi:hypothetical protein